tara:strand:+ start:611 stop:1678 length:1068 start_codon:yes stop_codon:yes gene_type:complete
MQEHPHPTPQDIRQAAEALLADSPDAPVCVRLLRDILGRPRSDTDLADAYCELDSSPWVQLFRKKQDSAGNFPRLRPDLRHVGVFYVVHISLQIGLLPDHPLLARTREFMERVLAAGVSESRGLLENGGCPFAAAMGDSLWELILASLLSRLNPQSDLVTPIVDRWSIICRRGFEHHDFFMGVKEAYEEVYGVEYPIAHCQRARPLGSPDCHETTTLFAANASHLDPEFMKCYLNWQWQQRVDPLLPVVETFSVGDRRSEERMAGLTSWLYMLSPLPGWSHRMGNIASTLWRRRETDGYWDFGGVGGGFAMRLSSNWRGKRRKQDWSVWVLQLLHLSAVTLSQNAPRSLQERPGE